MKRTSGGFSLAEVLLAAGTILVCILTVCVLLMQLLRSSRKTVDVSASELAADEIMNRIIYNAQHYDHTAFWDTDYPPPGGPHYRTGTYVTNRTEFSYELDAVTVMNDDTGGTDPVGDTAIAFNRLKQVTLRLRWWDASSAPTRAGYGRLTKESSRLVHEEQPQP